MRRRNFPFAASLARPGDWRPQRISQNRVSRIARGGIKRQQGDFAREFRHTARRCKVPPGKISGLQCGKMRTVFIRPYRAKFMEDRCRLQRLTRNSRISFEGGTSQRWEPRTRMEPSTLRRFGIASNRAACSLRHLREVEKRAIWRHGQRLL